jgi:rubrerythrin
MFSIIEIYDLAFQIEKNGEVFYRGALEKISDPSLRAMFEWLANEEVRHSQWFSQRRESTETKAPDPVLDEMGRAFLKDVLGDQSFSLKEADLSKIEKVEDLLAMAVEFEKDTILFFEMIGAFIQDPETSKGLEEIIEEENHHIQLMEEFLEQDAEPDGGV